MVNACLVPGLETTKAKPEWRATPPNTMLESLNSAHDRHFMASNLPVSQGS